MVTFTLAYSMHAFGGGRVVKTVYLYLVKREKKTMHFETVKMCHKLVNEFRY